MAMTLRSGGLSAVAMLVAVAGWGVGMRDARAEQPPATLDVGVRLAAVGGHANATYVGTKEREVTWGFLFPRTYAACGPAVGSFARKFPCTDRPATGPALLLGKVEWNGATTAAASRCRCAYDRPGHP